MYTLMLVEDEIIEMELLEQYVAWHEMNIRVVATAKNGKEALVKLETHKPDIVLTDVKMPLMDGLEFARRARQLHKGVKIVFLSGHHEFQYIKAALSVEAVGYLLKPVDLEELRELMETVKSKCDEEVIIRQNLDTAKERIMVNLLLEKDVHNRQKWALQLNQLPLPLPSFASYMVVYITIDSTYGKGSKTSLSSSYLIAKLQAALGQAADYVMGLELEEQAVGLILMTQDKPIWTAGKRYWKDLLSTLFPLPEYPALTLGLSNEGAALEDLPGLYSEAKERNEWKFHLGTGIVITADDRFEPTAADMKPEWYAEELCRAITNGDEQKMRSVLAELLSGLKQQRVRKSLVISQLLILLNEVESQFSSLLVNSTGGMLFANHWEQLSQLPSIDDLELYVIDACRQITNMIKSRQDNPSVLLLSRITELIQQRCTTALSVEEIAKDVYLSPNYVGALFKEATGETIVEAITKCRMRKATELLSDKSLKIHEVSRSVGYESVSYFCSVFHKYKGCTPNEYRKKIIL